MMLMKNYSPDTGEDSKNELSFRIPNEMLKSLCFNCDNRPHCVWKDERKIYCRHFE